MTDNDRLIPLSKKDKKFEEITNTSSRLKNQGLKLPINVKYFILANTGLMAFLSLKRKNLYFIGFAGAMNLFLVIYYLYDKF
jgi:hypothetical protein